MPRQTPSRWRSLANHCPAVALPQSGKYRGLYVDGLFTGRLRCLLSYQGVCNLPRRHWRASPPHHVHGTSKHRSALEPGIADNPALGGDQGDVEVGSKHFQDGLDLHHGRSDFDCRALVLKQLSGQLGM
jgi:hypothetical protein